MSCGGKEPSGGCTEAWESGTRCEEVDSEKGGTEGLEGGIGGAFSLLVAEPWMVSGWLAGSCLFRVGDARRKGSGGGSGVGILGMGKSLRTILKVHQHGRFEEGLCAAHTCSSRLRRESKMPGHLALQRLLAGLISRQENWPGLTNRQNHPSQQLQVGHPLCATCQQYRNLTG